jgi:tRNA(Ile)-lysidine synthase
MMTKLEKKLRASLRHLGRQLGIGPHSPMTNSTGSKPRVVVAVSGGADSTALFDALTRLCEHHQLNVTVLAAHLNHQLRGEESDADERFVLDMAARAGVAVFTERANIGEHAAAAKQNLEATARRLRYDFLLRTAEQNGACLVLTAHTQDDQAETILMRLLRGAGAEGLRGIQESRPLGNHVKLFRPLLSVTRSEVIAHCNYYDLKFRDDSSNLDTNFTRNRIRHELLPLLRDFNPGIDQTLSRTAELLAQDDDQLCALASESFQSTGERANLEIAPLVALAPAIRRRILRSWLKGWRGDLSRIEMAHIEAIDRLILHGQSGRRIELPNGGLVIREFNDLRFLKLEIFACVPRRVSQPSNLTQIDSTQLKDGVPQEFGAFRFTLKRGISPQNLEFNNDKKQELFFALLREDEKLGEMRLRTRFPGDAYIPANTARVIKLKTLMIRRKIPLLQRDKYPVLVAPDDVSIIWSPGLPVAREYAAKANDEFCALVIAEKLG